LGGFTLVPIHDPIFHERGLETERENLDPHQPWSIERADESEREREREAVESEKETR
jgi:hypothetical protein